MEGHSGWVANCGVMLTVLVLGTLYRGAAAVRPAGLSPTERSAESPVANWLALSLYQVGCAGTDSNPH